MYNQRRLRDQCLGLSPKLLPRYLTAFLIFHSDKRMDKDSKYSRNHGRNLSRRTGWLNEGGQCTMPRFARAAGVSHVHDEQAVPVDPAVSLLQTRQGILRAISWSGPSQYPDGPCYNHAILTAIRTVDVFIILAHCFLCTVPHGLLCNGR